MGQAPKIDQLYSQKIMFQFTKHDSLTCFNIGPGRGIEFITRFFDDKIN